MTPPAPARLVGYFARSAPICVIVRRGPSRHSQMILWHTDTDEFVPGQWIKGHVDAASLSSDGRYMAVSIMGGKPKDNSFNDQWSLICRPPYFTALEVWIGGLCMGSVRIATGDVILYPSHRHLAHASGRCPLRRKPDTDERYVTYDPELITDASRKAARGQDQQGREILFDKGQIFVVREGTPHLLFDTNPFKFEPIEAPDWARDW